MSILLLKLVSPLCNDSVFSPVFVLNAAVGIYAGLRSCSELPWLSRMTLHVSTEYQFYNRQTSKVPVPWPAQRHSECYQLLVPAQQQIRLALNQPGNSGRGAL